MYWLLIEYGWGIHTWWALKCRLSPFLHKTIFRRVLLSESNCLGPWASPRFFEWEGRIICSVATCHPKYPKNRKRHRIWATSFSNLVGTSTPDFKSGGYEYPFQKWWVPPPPPPPVATPLCPAHFSYSHPEPHNTTRKFVWYHFWLEKCSINIYGRQ